MKFKIIDADGHSSVTKYMLIIVYARAKFQCPTIITTYINTYI